MIGDDTPHFRGPTDSWLASCVLVLRRLEAGWEFDNQLQTDQAVLAYHVRRLFPK